MCSAWVLRYDDANDAACDYFRMSREELLGSALLGLFPGAAGAGLLEMYTNVIETGVPLVLDDAPYANELLGQERYYDLRGVRLDESMVFVIEMRHCTIADALPLAEKLRALVADCPIDEVGTVTVSIGAAELHPDDDLTSWLDRADRVMYEAKAAGRNAVRAFHPA